MIIQAVEIKLYNRRGQVVGRARVSPHLLAFLSQWKWSLLTQNGFSYARRTQRIEGKIVTFMMHRVVLEQKLGRPLLPWPQEEADHVDHDGLNNTDENLRVGTKSDNQSNTRLRRDSTSGYKGVHWHKKYKKWEIYSDYGGKRDYIGYFEECDLELAAR